MSGRGPRKLGATNALRAKVELDKYHNATGKGKGLNHLLANPL